jgi:hypothetical protein|tara:strand:- start:39 stop:173 length:135 start_codon:yes stop_codon:yes gene_type:complete
MRIQRIVGRENKMETYNKWIEYISKYLQSKTRQKYYATAKNKKK